MEKHYDIKTQLRNKFALHMLRVDLPSDFVETTNKYIDEELIPFDENFGRVKGNSELEHSYSKGLVGQIRQDKRSAQLDYGLLETDSGQKLKGLLDSCSNLYLQKIGFPDKIADVYESWTIHSYAGDYNPMHDHGVRTTAGLSMILYLKVPECIEKLENPSDKGGNVYLNNSSGEVDGFTFFSWANVGNKMYNMLYPAGESYVKPEVGHLLIFPNWLKHAVMPFYGDGERRTISANANVFGKDASIETIKRFR